MTQLLFVTSRTFYPQNLYIDVAFKTWFSIYTLHEVNLGLIVGGQKTKIKKEKK